MTKTPPQEIHIVGAGPAGLVAALTAARAGARVIVYEQRAQVGARFHGDLQGIENWTTTSDALEELSDIGVEPEFEARPVREGLFFDPNGREYAYRSRQPVLYLVHRGFHWGSLDKALEAQAIRRGVEIHFRRPSARLPEGGIVAGGPRAADAIAVGYVFRTEMPDGVFAAMSERLAPGGYAYLLVAGGRGTVAACLFRDFHRERIYRERTVEFFRERAGLRMNAPVPFGGAGNIFVPATARRGRILFAGEAAGFQDALWGFGIRIVALSGHLAARALLARSPADYDCLWRERLGGILRAAVTNRFLYSRFGDFGYRFLMARIARCGDARDWLRGHYSETVWKKLLFPAARRFVRSERGEPGCAREDCDCTWCRRHGESGITDTAARPGKRLEAASTDLLKESSGPSGAPAAVKTAPEPAEELGEGP